MFLENFIRHKLCGFFIPLMASLLILLMSCQNPGAVPSEPDKPLWMETVENTTIPNLTDVSTMFRVNRNIQTPTESWAIKFSSLQKGLEEVTGEPLPLYLTPELAEQTVQGWPSLRIRQIGGLGNIRNVSLLDSLQLFSEVMGFRMLVTEHGFLFSLYPEFHREQNHSGDVQILFPASSGSELDIFGLPSQ